MELEQDTKARRVIPKSTVRRDGSSPVAPGNKPLESLLLGHTDGNAPCFVSSAPLKLDVMSGLGDYLGAQVLQTPVAAQVTALVQPRDDARFHLTWTRQNGVAESRACHSKDLAGISSATITNASDSRFSSTTDSPEIRCLVGLIIEALQSGSIPGVDRGANIVLGTTFDGTPHVGVEAALVAAALTALAGANGIVLDPASAIDVCQTVVNRWMKIPVGRSDVLCALWGEVDVVTQLYCEPTQHVGSIRLPSSLTLLGIHCGVVRDGWLEKLEQARTAAFMGRYLIDRIITHERGNHAPWDRHLARISVADYVGLFRNRIPTKIKGEEFLNRFGETGDPLTTTNPRVDYKVRSRTEHHIYEHSRSCQFAQCLSRYERQVDDSALADIRDLMDASHWSYGQRCGLGCVETDLLANLIRQHGRESGIIGCRVSGRGAGGMLTVMLHNTQEAGDALHAAIDDYEQKSGKTVTVFDGASPGAMHGGCRKL